MNDKVVTLRQLNTLNRKLYKNRSTGFELQRKMKEMILKSQGIAKQKTCTHGSYGRPDCITENVCTWCYKILTEQETWSD